ncbi:MAG: nickel pincer cofactor biosynthesis protein LarC [Planctomycetota bacterium]|nr:nickel pincer cofactor biosynthesis protein LarC [Planctomycetota bacterium]
MHLHVDCSFGASGDMFLAALVDGGVDRLKIQETLQSLSLGEFSVTGEKVSRSGISALHLEVVESESATGHRHLADLLRLLDPDLLPARVRERASRVFHILAEAEGEVHSLPPSEVHFHEISGIDTAVDVIGTCLALELLGVDSLSATVPAAGSGMVSCEHGIFPIPAPATMEILKRHQIPWRQGGDGERLTPTGAALLAGLVDSFGIAPELHVVHIGYGAGKRDYSDAPNLLRIIVGKVATRQEEAGPRREAEPGEALPLARDLLFPPAEIRPEGGAGAEVMVEFRTLVDDMTPEAVAFLEECCFAAGAVEAYSLPATMKKGRQGQEITVLAPSSQAAAVAETIWQQSTTFGIRVRETRRLVLSREIRNVRVEGSPVRIKLGWYGGMIIRRQPEFADCCELAKRLGIPLEQVFRQAEAAAEELT